MNKEYIIMELIPSHSNEDKGIIVQIQALKLNGLELLERFDYRVNESLVNNPDLLKIISYDKDMFKYTDTEEELIRDFKKFIGKDKLLIIDNFYTRGYLKNIKNKKESIFDYLNIEYSNDVFDKIKEKYNLEDTNHLVDLLYEALLMEDKVNI